MSVRVERIGLATLYCGDCRDIAPTLPRPAAVVSDPPYFDTACRRVTEAQRQGDLLRDAPPGSKPYPRWAQAGLL